MQNNFSLYLLLVYVAVIAVVGYRSVCQSRKLRRKLDLVRKRICLGCGYDAHESELRCPECGRVIVSEAAVRGASVDPNEVVRRLESLDDAPQAREVEF
jgi:predicted amidophosphoribosyltransferase